MQRKEVKVHGREFCDLYFSLNVICVINPLHANVENMVSC
jgi:hypothetical protein